MSQIKLAMIPNAVYLAAQHAMRAHMLARYVGDLRELLEAPRLEYISLHSFNVQGVSTAVARRMLNDCANHRSFREMRRVSGVRVWRPEPWLYEHLRLDALQHWQKVGYVVGQRMPEIKTEGGAA